MLSLPETVTLIQSLLCYILLESLIKALIVRNETPFYNSEVLARGTQTQINSVLVNMSDCFDRIECLLQRETWGHSPSRHWKRKVSFPCLCDCIFCLCLPVTFLSYHSIASLLYFHEHILRFKMKSMTVLICTKVNNKGLLSIYDFGLLVWSLFIWSCPEGRLISLCRHIFTPMR